MSLMPEIFVGGQFRVDTLRLEHDADLATDCGRVLGGIAAHDHGVAGGWNHQRRKDAEESGFTTAVWT